MDEKVKAIIIDKVNNFLTEMHEWELFCIKNDTEKELTFDEKNIKQKEILIKIFEKYCTKKDRKNGKPNVISYGSYGGYVENWSEKIIEIIQDKESQISIYTQGPMDGIDKYVYIIVKYKGEWLIDSKKRYSRLKQKWVIENL